MEYIGMKEPIGFMIWVITTSFLIGGEVKQNEAFVTKIDAINFFEKMEKKNPFLYGKKWMSYIPVCIQRWIDSPDE